jgi:hypothetical protein
VCIDVILSHSHVKYSDNHQYEIEVVIYDCKSTKNSMESKTMLIILAAIAATGFLAISNISISAFAEGKLPESGFGQASKDLATSSPGATGEHASSFPTPREGIGNVAKDNGLTVGQLGCALGQLNC